MHTDRQEPSVTVEAVTVKMVAVNAPSGVRNHLVWKQKHQEAKRFNQTPMRQQVEQQQQVPMLDNQWTNNGFLNRVREEPNK